MGNFINEAVLGKNVVQEGFLDELVENPLIRLVIFIGTVAFAGYFIIIFCRESWGIVFRRAVTHSTTETFINP